MWRRLSNWFANTSLISSSKCACWTTRMMALVELRSSQTVRWGISLRSARFPFPTGQPFPVISNSLRRIARRNQWLVGFSGSCWIGKGMVKGSFSHQVSPLGVSVPVSHHQECLHGHQRRISPCEDIRVCFTRGCFFKDSANCSRDTIFAGFCWDRTHSHQYSPLCSSITAIRLRTSNCGSYSSTGEWLHNPG